jgi:hypothetical protein
MFSAWPILFNLINKSPPNSINLNRIGQQTENFSYLRQNEMEKEDHLPQALPSICGDLQVIIITATNTPNIVNSIKGFSESIDPINSLVAFDHMQILTCFVTYIKNWELQKFCKVGVIQSKICVSPEVTSSKCNSSLN